MRGVASYSQVARCKAEERAAVLTTPSPTRESVDCKAVASRLHSAFTLADLPLAVLNCPRTEHPGS